MGIISINPDADGDLHDASLHNIKFQTILNEINGELDETNLKYPKSIIQFPFSARSGVLDYTGTSLPQIAWGPTDVAADRQTQLEPVSGAAPTPGTYGYPALSGAGNCNIYLNSITANVTGQTINLVAPSAGVLTWQATQNFTNNNIVVYFQKSATINGNAWEDMASATINPFHATGENRSSTFTIIDGVLQANHFFRVLVQNNAGALLTAAAAPANLTGPPLSSGAAYFTVQHVA